MKTHELKTTAPHFEHVRSGAKRAEIRRDDRGFAVGDVLVLREYDAATDVYSGREVRATVVHVLAGYETLAPGFVMLSVEPQSSALATARAEAALAERGALLQEISRIASGLAASMPMNSVTAHVVEQLHALRNDLREYRARTTPATLSTDTLAAIAEARGLRVLTAERVAELEAFATKAEHG